MIQPILNLIFGITVLIIFTVFLFPKYGLYAFYKKSKISRQKIYVEDSLKFLYESEYEKLTITLNQLSGYLKVKGESFKNILHRLEEMNLAEITDDNIKLTNQGSEYALRIIRTHRIWEKYLAEETSIRESEWHSEAEEKEHSLTESEIEEINRTIGNPLYDPHGDPIPTKTGELPPFMGLSFNDFAEGDTVRIIHIEDQPKEIYKKIIEHNISVGAVINILKIGKDSVEIELNGKKIKLLSELTKNITLEKIKEEVYLPAGAIPLSDLEKGKNAVVLSILKSCRGQQRRRLLDFGIVPGSKISTEIESLGNDPRGYKVRGTIVALRNSTAKQILVEKV